MTLTKRTRRGNRERSPYRENAAFTLQEGGNACKIRRRKNSSSSKKRNEQIQDDSRTIRAILDEVPAQGRQEKSKREIHKARSFSLRYNPLVSRQTRSRKKMEGRNHTTRDNLPQRGTLERCRRAFYFFTTCEQWKKWTKSSKTAKRVSQ